MIKFLNFRCHSVNDAAKLHNNFYPTNISQTNCMQNEINFFQLVIFLHKFTFNV